MTGASSGIGLAIATMLAEEGYDLTVVSRTPEKIERAAAELAARGTEVHPSPPTWLDAEEIGRAVAAHRERFGRLDVLVNNAGMGIHGEHRRLPGPSMIDLQLALNLRSVILLYSEALDLLRVAAAEHRNALVINMSSIVGKRGDAGLAVYSAAKHGVVGFTEAMNEELSGEGIKSCVLCPGFVDTELADYAQNPVPAAEMIRTADVAETVRSVLRLSPNCVIPEIPMTRPGREAVVRAGRWAPPRRGATPRRAGRAPARSHVATIALAGPERRNVLDAETATALREAAEAVAADPEVALRDPHRHRRRLRRRRRHQRDRGRQRPREPRLQPPAAGRGRRRRRRCRCPRSPPLNGHAIGGGLELALACTLRVAAAAAKLGMPEARLGIIPATGGLARLPRLIGPRRRARLLLTGELLDGAEAERLGHRRRSPSTPARVLDGGRRPGRADRRRGAALDARDRRRPARATPAARSTRPTSAPKTASPPCSPPADRREGAAAFLERREPRFTGR